jgi:uncharacterized protein
MSTEVRELVAGALVDHHCHGVVEQDLERAQFELLMTESDHPAPTGTSHFDTPLGLSIRRHCAPLLDLEPGVPPDQYLERRTSLGAAEVNRRLLRATGMGDLLIETGYRSDDILDPAAMAERAGARAYEVVRVERVAEQLAEDGVQAADYAETFAERLHAASTGAVGLKTIVAYRGGFRADPSPPPPAEVSAAAGAWLTGAGPHRLEDPTLLRFGLHTAIQVAHEHGIPLQFHVGFGDADISMYDNDPTLLEGWIGQAAERQVVVTLLHCYPYHRHAAWLSAVHPNVYVDVGLTLNYVGAAAPRIFEETCELAPLTKHLFSSDAFGLAELYHLGALRFRRSLATMLERWLTEDECDVDDAAAIAAWIGGDNARRIYPLERARAW